MVNLIFLTQLLSLLLSKILAENIEISTVSNLTPSTFNPHLEKSTNSEDISFLKSVENYLSDEGEKSNENQIQGYIPQPMLPVYPAYNSGGYFYPGLNPNAVASRAPIQGTKDVQRSSYFSAIIPAAQMGFEILRNLFLYFLVRYFILKIITILDLVLDIREVLLSDETSTFVTKAALQAGFKLFAKVGLFVMAGAALLIIGGIFTTLVCHVTPFCTISFNGYDLNGLNKEAVKSLMTPEKIASAAALVQDAIGKYQRLQRAVGSVRQ